MTRLVSSFLLFLFVWFPVRVIDAQVPHYKFVRSEMAVWRGLKEFQGLKVLGFVSLVHAIVAKQGAVNSCDRHHRGLADHFASSRDHLSPPPQCSD